VSCRSAISDCSNFSHGVEGVRPFVTQAATAARAPVSAYRNPSPSAVVASLQ
jgi:hypothetical protein